MPSSYADDPEWADIAPIPHNDGGSNPLAAIAYTDEYAEAMSYLRAIMADNEVSQRALVLTGHIISLNPAHYTVWLYRAKLLRELPDADLKQEVKWVNTIALANLKNYQIWHHRQGLLDTLNDPKGEIEFINEMLEADAKNYHVWSYRQWLVKRFDMWDQGELQDMERMIDDDVRNNSAWNHRFYIVNARCKLGRSADKSASPTRGAAMSGVRDKKIRVREIEFAKAKILLAPQNESPWSYLRGTLDEAGESLDAVQDFCEQFADLNEQGQVKSRYALNMLADIHATGNKSLAHKAYELLASKYDPIRANYWNYQKLRLEQTAVTT